LKDEFCIIYKIIRTRVRRKRDLAKSESKTSWLMKRSQSEPFSPLNSLSSPMPLSPTPSGEIRGYDYIYESRIRIYTGSSINHGHGSGSKFFDPGQVKSAIFGLGLENFH